MFDQTSEGNVITGPDKDGHVGVEATSYWIRDNGVSIYFSKDDLLKMLARFEPTSNNIVRFYEVEGPDGEGDVSLRIGPNPNDYIYLHQDELIQLLARFYNK